jgi:predicted unusual protein kinase regulating ubiquinone biosynthesis (AarF/ABC1/UbiB family)
MEFADRIILSAYKQEFSDQMENDALLSKFERLSTLITDPIAPVHAFIPLSTVQVATKLWGLAIRFRFKLPPYFTLVLRNLASLEGIGLTVDPSFKVFASAYPHVVRKLVTENAPVTRRVLRTLLTDGERGVRWDRMAALAGSFPGGTSGTGL